MRLEFVQPRALIRINGAPNPGIGALMSCWKNGAGDEIRTHDPNLGKVVLYP